MVSSISNSFNFNEAVTQLYTANSTAKLVKTTIDAYIKGNPNVKINTKDFIDFDDEDSEKSINDILKDYTKNTAEHLREMQKQLEGNKLTKEDYQNAGMRDYYEVQSALQMSKAISAYSTNNTQANNYQTNTFTIGV